VDIGRGRIDDALARLQNTSGIYPESPAILTRMARAMQAKSKNQEALEYLLRAYRKVPGSAWIGADLAICYVSLGQREEALSVLRDLTKQSQPHSIPDYSLASVYAALGEVETAFEHLERAYSRRSVELLWLKIDRKMQPLRGDPRFGNFLRRLRLSE
jgi:tetratricopeptide (TPR) repeat protein